MEPVEVNLKSTDKMLGNIIYGASLIGVLLVGVGAYIVLPYLITLAENILIFGVEILAGLALLSFAAQLVFARDAIMLKMRLFARNLRRRVVEEDPIGTIDEAITAFQSRLEEIDRLRSTAAASLQRMKNRIRSDRKDGMLDKADGERRLADAAERATKPQAEIDLHAIASERWKQSAGKIQPMVEQQEFTAAQLEKARDLAANAIANLTNQREVLSVEYDAYKDSMAQARAFKKFFGKNPELENINFAVDAVEKQTTQAQAEINTLMHQLTPDLQRQELERQAEAAEALEARRAAQQLDAANITPPLALSQAKAVVRMGETR